MLLSNGGVEEVDEENDIVVGTNGSVYVKGRGWDSIIVSSIHAKPKLMLNATSSCHLSCSLSMTSTTRLTPSRRPDNCMTNLNMTLGNVNTRRQGG